MNIFVLDKDPSKAAIMLCDKHLIKMILETAQLLCSPHENAPYKRTHFNHPCSKWARESKENYEWLINHGLSLCSEYTEYFGKVHKSESVIEWAKDNMGNIEFSSEGMTDHPLCMPDQYKCDDPIQSYRNYYLGEKMKFAKWSRGRKKPDWI